MHEFHAFIQHLRDPAYIHILLNPLPLYGMVAGLFLLVLERIVHPSDFPKAALVWIIFVAIETGLTVYFGQKGMDVIFQMADNKGSRWLLRHQQRALWSMYVFYATGLSAFIALIAHHRKHPLATRLILPTGILAFISILAAIWISHAGGQVIHAEFR